MELVDSYLPTGFSEVSSHGDMVPVGQLLFATSPPDAAEQVLGLRRLVHSLNGPKGHNLAMRVIEPEGSEGLFLWHPFVQFTGSVAAVNAFMAELNRQRTESNVLPFSVGLNTTSAVSRTE